MKLLSVGLVGTTNEVRNKLQNDCSTLAKEGFRVAIDEVAIGGYTFLGCNVVEGELSFRNYERIKNLLKKYVAVIVSDWIVNHEEKNMIKKIIDHNYYYFNEEDRTMIYNTTIRLLNDNMLSDDFGSSSRQHKISSKILEYLDFHHELIVEGFINFRLKDYREKLTEFVDKSVDEYMMELEYKDFIAVLRYFVDVQEPKIDIVHVIVDTGGKYKVLDAAEKPCSNQYLETFTNGNNGISYEDLVITALITLAPYHIMLHCSMDSQPQIFETIKNVFDSRVITCKGCEVCIKTIHS